MISPFNPTGASCLIPPPNREPMPATIITNVVFILFLLFFSFFKLTSKNCKEVWSLLIFRTKSFYKSLKLLFRIHKMIRCILTICSWSANCYKLYSLGIPRCDSKDSASRIPTDKPFIFSNCSSISVPPAYQNFLFMLSQIC